MYNCNLPVIAFFPVIILIILLTIMFLKRSKNTTYNILIMIMILYIYYMRNIKIMTTIVKSYIIGKSDGDKKLKLKTSKLFNDIFTLKTEFKNLNTNPTIFIANYPERYPEYLSIMLIPKNLSIILRGDVLFKEFVDKPIKKNPTNSTYENIKKQIKNSLEQNTSVFGYCTICEPYKLFKLKMRTGLFRIAKELNVTITPVVFDIVDIDNFFSIKQQNYEIYIGESFYVSDIEKDVKTVRKLFKDKLKEFKQNKYIFT